MEPQWACPDSVHSDVHHGKLVITLDLSSFFHLILGSGLVWPVTLQAMDMGNKDSTFNFHLSLLAMLKQNNLNDLYIFIYYFVFSNILLNYVKLLLSLS